MIKFCGGRRCAGCRQRKEPKKKKSGRTRTPMMEEADTLDVMEHVNTTAAINNQICRIIFLYRSNFELKLCGTANTTGLYVFSFSFSFLQTKVNYLNIIKYYKFSLQKKNTSLQSCSINKLTTKFVNIHLLEWERYKQLQVLTSFLAICVKIKISLDMDCRGWMVDYSDFTIIIRA